MSQQSTCSLVMNFNLSTLQSSLVQNFNAISNAISNQNNIIQSLRNNIFQLEKKLEKPIIQEEILPEEDRKQMASQVKQEAQEYVNQNEEILKPQIKNYQAINQQNKNQVTEIVGGVSSSLIEETIKKMNQRITELEINQSKNMKINIKKIRQIYCEVSSYQTLVEKNTNNTKMYEQEVQKLRKELNQYKFKKEAQVIRMLSNQTETKNQNQELTFAVQKIQQLSNYVGQLAEKVKVQESMEELNKRINRINHQMKSYINSSELESSISMLNQKITKVQNNRKSQKQYIKNQQSQNNEIDEQEDLNPESYIDKTCENQKKINRVIEQLKQIHDNITFLQNTSKNNGNEIQRCINISLLAKEKMQFGTKSHETFMHEMNTIYNSKFTQIEAQMNQSQQTLERLGNQMKFYQYQSRSETNTSAKELNPANQARNIQFQNDMAQFKKKINKINLKVQNMHSDFLSMRTDFVKDIDLIKMNIERKADWESTKKAFNFFEEQMKEITIFINNNISSLGKEDPSKDQVSLIAKKVWTCLVCDKELKNYEGKLGEVKFGSVFPSRYESPRIGGYYKQSQGDKQYKALYLSKQRKEPKSLIQRGSRQILN